MTAPLPWLSLVWAGVLASVPSAVTAATALRLYGLPTFGNDERIVVAVDHSRRVLPLRGVVLRRRRNLALVVHPARRPPSVRVEEAVLQAAASAKRPTDGIAVIADACQHRLTTPERLRDALALAPRLKGRATWQSVLDDVASGAHSMLEIGYLRRVERAHGLPELTRQVVSHVDGEVIRRDGLYDLFGVAVEVDGRLGHEWARDRRADLRRDAAAIGDGLVTLRFGYADVIDACATAGLIVAALAARGWTGLAKPCGPKCPLAKSQNR
jgi:hypothetical protein